MIQKIKRNVLTKVIAFTLMVVMVAQCAIVQQNVKADDSVFLEITGYQVSTTLEAYRTLYSIADPSGKTEEVGLVYGLTDSVTEADMIVGSTNSTVFSYAATSAGKSEINYSDNADATTYVRTMTFIKSPEFFNEDLSIRAYAKLTDGSYIYSSISTVSVFRIADTLYQNRLMSNINGHNYLYDSILTVVDPSYQEVEYDAGSIIVPIETTTEAAQETTTVETSKDHTLNTSLAQPAGLTWAGNDDLPHYFAWGAVDGADSYDVYVNGKYVANVVGASANLDASVFTNGAGTYTIGVGAVFGNEVSAATTIEYTYGTSGDITTTTAQEVTTTKEQETTVDDGYTDCVIDAKTLVGKWGYHVGAWAGASATYAGGAELNDFTLNITANGGSAWGVYAFTAPIDTNIGSTYTVKVTLNSTTAGASVLLKDDASGTELETKALVAGDNVFTGTFTAADNAEFVIDLGAVAAGTTVKVTSFSLTETATAATTTQAQTTAVSSNRPVNSSLAQPAGLTWAGNDTLPLYFAWGAVDGASSYDVYVNGKYVMNVTDAAANIPSSAFTNGSGTYSIGVGAVFGNEVSNATTISFSYTSSGVIVTTAAGTQPTTSASDSSFPTDSSIPQPFGMVLSSPENGYVNVVWGAGEINCYNVYVDGERRRTGIKAQSLTLPVYFEGTHTVEIATVVDTRESVRIAMSIAVVGIGEKETEPPTCPPELQPQLRSDLSFRDDRVLMQLNNKTNGRYSDSQVYWCLVGYNTSGQLCYLNNNGDLIPVNTGMNNITIGNRQVADVSYTLAEASYVYVPTIRSGRMYLSYEKPIYLTFNQAADGTIGFAGPDVNNDTDPNAGTLFEFAEFTIEGKYYWGNTTRVDFFSFPVVTRLIGHTQYEKYDKTVGDIGTRDEIFAAFRNEVPDAFKTLVNDKRIMAPCKTTFNVGQQYGNYFDAYINEFWNKYTYEDLVFNCEGGTFTGRVEGNRMRFTRSGDGTAYYVDKPTTQDVLEGKGAFARGNSTELVIEAQLCAAFNRGVATEPSKWNKPQYYYQNSTNNAYSGFFHRHSITGLAYGFCYDDVNDQSTLLWYDYADALVIDLKW